MAKLDWKKLEQAFRREHARTGIKLQDWCRQNNICYGTARRYIKLRKNSPKNTEESAQKNAQKILKKTAQIRQKRNATADRAILTPLPGLATVTPTP